MRVPIMKTVFNEDRDIILKKERTMYVSEVCRISSPQEAADILERVYEPSNCTEEHVYLLCLDAACKLRGAFELSHGTVNRSMISNRDIFQKCLLCGAVSFIVAHNHPSGDLTPSLDDIAVAERIKKASDIMGVPMNDFLILGDYCLYSFRECDRL